MDYDSTRELFTIYMWNCPSKRRLLENEHLSPYHDYCGHCAVLYSRVLEPLGLEYVMDTTDCDHAVCRVVIFPLVQTYAKNTPSA